MDSQLYDFIIIGAGVAGLTAGQYGARSGLRTLILDLSTSGGQALHITILENYPGIFPAVSGTVFIKDMEQQALSFGAELKQTTVLSIDKIGQTFILKTSSGIFSSYGLLIATGAAHKFLGVPGEKEFSGRGVSYCASCDGPFFREKNIIVVGGGDSACDEAVYLSVLSPHVTLIHRREQLRAQHAVAEKLFSNRNIRIRYNSVIKEIRGKERAESVLLADVHTGMETELPADGIFIFTGMIPRTELVPMLPVDEGGYIKTGDKMETHIPGLYCAGDVRSKPFRQLITAASDGAVAAHQAEKYICSIKQTTGASL
jgi:thioredoxin reductase (NADPH)